MKTYSASSSISNDQNRNDGINYWKGKKIISTKAWNDLYQKSLTYTDTYKITLTSRKPLQYFPDDYNGSISTAEVVDEKLKEEVQKWNTDYYELLEYRRNPTLGRMKCTKCLLSGSNDDPIFVGIEKVFARIVANQCNNNIPLNTHSNGFISYHCNIMNVFSCPFESKEESKLPYTKEDLFALHQISFVIEQAISTFLEITKNNEIIYEADFENDRVHETHTNYYGEPESWGWQENISEQLSKVKPISNIIIRDEQDIYSILTNREKLECLLQEKEKIQEDELDKEYSKIELKEQIKEELEQSDREQQILLKEYKQNIIDFIINNKDSIRIEDLKISEPFYKCYRKKGNCIICNSLSNIICTNCCNTHEEIWLCTNHWQQHEIGNHHQNR